MQKAKQGTVTEPVKEFKVSPEEMRFIEEFRLRNKDIERVEQMKSIKQIQLDAAREKKAEEKRLWDAKIVRGTFKYNELPGATLNFTLKLHKNDPVKEYSLVDGKTYEIPRGVAIHLNENGKYTIHARSVDKDGKPMVTVGRKEDRYTFYSTDFIDITDGNAASALGPTPNIDIVKFG